ncbi:MAG: hypothetical protein CHACPFDD_01479 [Phycisphaerae bacterium]|nr:hypothetical protein [Phycisphaerae bacterium]
MDAQTRHSLKTNELGEFLIETRDYLLGRGRYTVMLVVAVVVVAAIAFLWSSSAKRAIYADWQRLTAVQLSAEADNKVALDELRALAGHSDAGLRRFAQLRLGMGLIRQSEVDATGRAALIDEAIRTLKGLYEDGAAPANLSAAAGIGLATAYEDQRDLAAAKAIYDALATQERFKATPYVTIAAARAGDVLTLTPVALVPGLPPPPASAVNAPAAPPAASQPASAAVAASGAATPSTQGVKPADGATAAPAANP